MALPTFELPNIFQIEGRRIASYSRDFLGPYRQLHTSVFGTMDPFEVRMQFISNLKKLNA